jgi:hypothetical protein
VEKTMAVDETIAKFRAMLSDCPWLLKSTNIVHVPFKDPNAPKDKPSRTLPGVTWPELNELLDYASDRDRSVGEEDVAAVPAEGESAPAGESVSTYFMQNGSQYYTMARFAAHAQRMPVGGNLFHHAVEMLLKGGLARKRPLSDLIGHDLKVLWRKFKTDFPDPTLSRHDKTISGLNKFEDIRYPNPSKVPSMGVSLEWFGPPGTITTYGNLKTPKQYAVVVSPIDDLVADIFNAANWSPSCVSFLGGPNPAALEAVIRNNAHAEFLTKRS